MSKALKRVKDLHPLDTVKGHVDTVEVSRKARRLVPAAVQRKVSLSALKVAKHSPSLLLVGGVAAGVAGTVLACRATLKAPLLVEEFKEKRSMVVDIEHDNYSDGDRRRDLTVLYIQTASKFTKLYGPAFILGVTSVVALTGSHKILSNRYAAVSAAYTGVTEAFDQYRERVVEDQGEDKDREYRYGTKTVTETVDTPNGPKKVKRKVADTDGDHSMYARRWNQHTSKQWKNHGDSNKATLILAQCWANDKLKAQGYLFLNDVYKLLGLTPTTAGQRVGWTWKPGAAGIDNHVDFGLHENNVDVQKFFEDGEGGVWLDFNVDGIIDQLLDEI